MMSRATQVVTLRWEETGEESLPKLHDIQPDGSGRLDWAAVKKDFCADVVKVEGATPSTIQEGALKGLTRDFFQAGSTVLVAVTCKAPGCQLDKLSQELAAFAQAQLEISAKLDQVLEESGSSATRQASPPIQHSIGRLS
ncbi:hypothetical protein CVIRNUC_003935 [Coccomyxa viridis]|uniref:Uncharacterized protein n=1 Tax=Coccomyxa viridis TaxID=1274662 RepID=A0AAV1I2N8_9CHLO|nr:hypothetical protein CVIRNUC_003935 [Coccomyxa viridis]